MPAYVITCWSFKMGVNRKQRSSTFCKHTMSSACFKNWTWWVTRITILFFNKPLIHLKLKWQKRTVNSFAKSSFNCYFPSLLQKFIFLKRNFVLHFHPVIYTSHCLKELRNCILCVICVWPLFCSIRVYASLHFLPIFLEN